MGNVLRWSVVVTVFEQRVGSCCLLCSYNERMLLQLECGTVTSTGSKRTQKSLAPEGGFYDSIITCDECFRDICVAHVCRRRLDLRGYPVLPTCNFIPKSIHNSIHFFSSLVI